MKIFSDYTGRNVRLTPEREDHILDHAEMIDLVERVGEILAQPERVVLSISDSTVQLFYSFVRGT